MPNYDWRCAAGHWFEDNTPRDQFLHTCTECGDEAQRQLGVPNMAVEGRVITPKGQRTLDMREFQEAGAQLDHERQKQEYERDMPLELPNYTDSAKERGLDALAGKIAPPEGWTDPYQADGTNRSA